MFAFCTSRLNVATVKNIKLDSKLKFKKTSRGVGGAAASRFAALAAAPPTPRERLLLTHFFPIK
jgi:hypothetical protein